MVLKNILIVEDEKPYRKMLQEAIHNTLPDHAILLASDLTEADAILRTQTIGALVTDNSFPRGTQFPYTNEECLDISTAQRSGEMLITKIRRGDYGENNKRLHVFFQTAMNKALEQGVQAIGPDAFTECHSKAEFNFANIIAANMKALFQDPTRKPIPYDPSDQFSHLRGSAKAAPTMPTTAETPPPNAVRISGLKHWWRGLCKKIEK